MKNTGSLIWITGLAASGKSTLASAVAILLREQRIPTVLLDGDVLRSIMGRDAVHGQNYDRKARVDLAFCYANMCKMLTDQGITVVIATICLVHEIHTWNRKNIPHYFEVYLDTPEQERRRRDPKGLYAAFDKGECTHIVGLDVPFDIPQCPDMKILFSPNQTVDNTAQEILTHILTEDKL